MFLPCWINSILTQYTLIICSRVLSQTPCRRDVRSGLFVSLFRLTTCYGQPLTSESARGLLRPLAHRFMQLSEYGFSRTPLVGSSMNKRQQGASERELCCVHSGRTIR